MTYVKTRAGRSWHILKSDVLTRCGRWYDPDAESFDYLPAGKSCETCLRWVAREVERNVTG